MAMLVENANEIPVIVGVDDSTFLISVNDWDMLFGLFIVVYFILLLFCYVPLPNF